MLEDYKTNFSVKEFNQDENIQLIYYLFWYILKFLFFDRYNQCLT